MHICHVCKTELDNSMFYRTYGDKPTCSKCFNTFIWDGKLMTHVEMPKEMKDFLNDIELICKKHNLSISHEDSNGKFEITLYDENYIDWLRHASKTY